MFGEQASFSWSSLVIERGAGPALDVLCCTANIKNPPSPSVAVKKSFTVAVSMGPGRWPFSSSNLTMR